MLRLNKSLKLVIVTVLILNGASCTKPAGPGGRATVKGKVYAYDFDNTQRYIVSKGYSSAENVYICYGNNSVVGNDVKTSTDGSFEFRYLNKGHYKVFVNSVDTAIKVKGNNTKIPVIKEFDITATSQTIDLGDITINK
ncbi:MAG: hypothetical protein H0W61_15400 [Bacteroidetes bacterium]|nr:hypothetical protein [Bacteroidota bacterium]